MRTPEARRLAASELKREKVASFQSVGVRAYVAAWDGLARARRTLVQSTIVTVPSGSKE